MDDTSVFISLVLFIQIVFVIRTDTFQQLLIYLEIYIPLKIHGFKITTSFSEFIIQQSSDMDQGVHHYLFMDNGLEIHFRDENTTFSIKVCKQSSSGSVSTNTRYILTDYLDSRFDLNMRYKLDQMYNRSRIIEDMHIESNDPSIEHLIRMNQNHLPIIDHISHRFHVNIQEGRIKHEVTNDLRFIRRIVAGYTDIAFLLEQEGGSRFELSHEINTETQDQNLENACIICFKAVKQDGITMQCCDHLVHKNHLSMWLKRKNTCPYCGRKNPKVNLLTIGSTRV